MVILKPRKPVVFALWLVAAAAIGYLCHLVLPPEEPILPKGAYDEAHLGDQERLLKQLADDYRADFGRNGESTNDFKKRVGDKYDRRFQHILGKDLAPEDTAMLALWAYRQPGFWPDQIYMGLFFGGIAELGHTTGDRARFALRKIKEQVVADGKFDAHYAETLTEAEENQKRLNKGGR